MTDFTVPSSFNHAPRPLAGQPAATPGKTADDGVIGPIAGSEALTQYNRRQDDNLAFSFPALMTSGTSPEASATVRECYQLVQQPLPLAEKLNKLDDIVARASTPLGLKNNYAAIKEVRAAAALVGDRLINDEMARITGDSSLTPPQQRQQLQDLQQSVKESAWLPAHTKAELRVKVSFGAAMAVK